MRRSALFDFVIFLCICSASERATPFHRRHCRYFGATWHLIHTCIWKYVHENKNTNKIIINEIEKFTSGQQNSRQCGCWYSELIWEQEKKNTFQELIYLWFCVSSISCFLFNQTVLRAITNYSAPPIDKCASAGAWWVQKVAKNTCALVADAHKQNWFNRHRTANPINLNQKRPLHNRICSDFRWTYKHLVCVCVNVSHAIEMKTKPNVY